jgi:photosystem II stability/assembly factor-like uncharacterized protein
MMTQHEKYQAALLIGTNKGVYRTLIQKSGKPERVLDSNTILRLKQFGEEIYAATRSGLFRSNDGGETWKNLNVPRTEVYSVVKNSDGSRLYAGTHPAHLYVSEDNGISWQELKGLQELPSRDSWRLPRHRNEAHVRSLGVHPDAPGRLIAGIEVGGVHVSEDNGETWTERRDGLQNDIHHVLILGAEEYIASTGGGLYRTRDSGRSWTRLDENLDHSYFREAFKTNGHLFAAAARQSPPHWSGGRGTDAALFESTDGGDSFQSVPYPGRPQDFVLAWTAIKADENDVFAGTRNGNVLQRINGKWTSFGTVSSSIRSLIIV